MTAEHPTRRLARAHYRPPPARVVERQAAWRASIRDQVTGNSGVIWTGPSAFDGSPVVVVAAGLRPAPTPNVKTGDMLQLYILPADVDPPQAVRTGADRGVCGTCIHRPSGGERADCYVTVSWGPGNLWRGVQSGRIPRIDVALLVGAAVRFGAWGDPAAVPLEVWRPILFGATTHTGYTQRWVDLDVQDWGWLMASVATPWERRRASTRGWRTFRAAYPGDRLTEHEKICPAVEHGVTCIACGGCQGQRTPGRSDYVVPAHGFRRGRAGDAVVDLSGAQAQLFEPLDPDRRTP